MWVGLLCDLLWSDPDKDITGWSENDRGVSFTFGPDVVSRFLQKHDMDLICRAHQVRTLFLLTTPLFFFLSFLVWSFSWYLLVVGRVSGMRPLGIARRRQYSVSFDSPNHAHPPIHSHSDRTHPPHIPTFISLFTATFNTHHTLRPILDASPLFLYRDVLLYFYLAATARVPRSSSSVSVIALRLPFYFRMSFVLDDMLLFLDWWFSLFYIWIFCAGVDDDVVMPLVLVANGR